MGVAGLWDILRPAGETRSLTHLAVIDGFERNTGGVRGFRVGIDASIWFYHATYGREGENPELRTLFFRCTRLMSMPFLPLFVFDGPKRPEVKRGKRISGKDHWMIQGMQAIINAFGFEWRMAPGEAEAELAYLNRTGIIDAVMSDDVDTFLFGATMVVRNPSVNLSGNRAHSLKNSAGRDDGNHVATYKSQDIAQHPKIKLTQGGLILIGILRGGDYHQAGLTGCGGTIAHGLAKCGFGDTLLKAARTLPSEHLPEFLSTWRDEIREELRTNSQGHIGRRHPSLAKSIPEDFPNIDVLLSYANPITSETKGKTVRDIPIDWEKEPDLGKIAGLCEMYFEWGVKEIIIKRFRTVLWPSAVLRILRRAALLSDKKAARAAERLSGAPPATPRKNGREGPTAPGTPSSMISKHFSSMQLNSPASQHVEEDDEDDEERLIVKIHSSRQHVSTDGVPEYRLEIAPAQLVRLCEAGVKGLRTALITGLDDDDEDRELDEDEDGGESKGKAKAKKPPPNPLSHLRMWLPASMVRIVEPELVDEFDGVQQMRQAKKVRKSTSSRSKSGSTAGSKVKGKKKAAVPLVAGEEALSSASGIPKKSIARDIRKAAKLAGPTSDIDDEFKRSNASDKGLASRPPNLKKFFATSKGVKEAKSKTLSSTSKNSTRLENTSSSSARNNSIGAKFLTTTDLSDTSDDEPCDSRKSTYSTHLPFLTASSRTSGTTTSSALSSICSELEEDSNIPPPKPSLPAICFKPRPFPMSLDDELRLKDGNPSGTTTRPYRSLAPQQTHPRPSTSSDSGSQRCPLQKSPHTEEHTQGGERTGSPSPLRRYPLTSTIKPLTLSPKIGSLKTDMSVIEISSDSDTPLPTKVAPLLLAKAKTNNNSRIGSMATSRPKHAKSSISIPKKLVSSIASRPSKHLDPDDIIDLT
ncbi:hypothetical protein AcV7_010189 [Taiwanofungus camphoratus]|nr:hypothetical protein AcV7_010189 [Antrodia cinnamomea]